MQHFGCGRVMPNECPQPSICSRKSPARQRSAKSEHVRILEIEIDRLRPSPENDQLYRPVDPADPEIVALSISIGAHGVREPLVTTEDYFLISGHRRFVAAKLVGLKSVPCRIEPVRRLDNPGRFLLLLREHNRQRHKSFDERLREELLNVDTRQAHQSLVEFRSTRSRVKASKLELHGVKRRAKISSAKQPFLDAVIAVIKSREEFWPISDRQVHYALLNDPPLRHASKNASRYANSLQSYRDLTDLLTRARIDGAIPFEAIADETRPVTTWAVYREPSAYVRKQMGSLLRTYWRDLMQSQPNHIEVVVEKNSVAPICRQVCEDYCIPMTSGRGYCSLPPRHEMVTRYRQSGKEQLVLLLISDFDPDGEEIAHSFARSLRDDFGVDRIHPIKVALTAEQVQAFELPPGMEAKSGSANHAKFVNRHGGTVWEVEALPPTELQRVLRAAIDNVIDVEAFEHERKSEHEDARFLAGLRSTVVKAMRAATLLDGDED